MHKFRALDRNTRQLGDDGLQQIFSIDRNTYKKVNINKPLLLRPQLVGYTLQL